MPEIDDIASERVHESRPPLGFTPLEAWELGSPDQLSALRSLLTSRLDAEGFASSSTGADVPSRIALIATELATNALRHGRPPTIVRLHKQDSHFLLEVADHDLQSAPVYAAEREPGHGGFGMHLARRLTHQVGWYVDGETKTVWATFGGSPTDSPSEVVAGGQTGHAERAAPNLVRLVGEVDAHLSETLLDIAGAFTADDAPVVVDVSQVTFMDSTGVRFIAQLYNRSGDLVVLEGATPRVLFVLEAMGLSDIVRTA